MNENTTTPLLSPESEVLVSAEELEAEAGGSCFGTFGTLGCPASFGTFGCGG